MKYVKILIIHSLRINIQNLISGFRMLFIKKILLNNVNNLTSYTQIAQ